MAEHKAWCSNCGKEIPRGDLCTICFWEELKRSAERREELRRKFQKERDRFFYGT